MDRIFNRLTKEENNIEWFNHIRSGNRLTTYEVELFIEKYEDYFNSNLKYEFFHLGSYEEVEEAMDVENNYFNSGEFSKKIKKSKINIFYAQIISFIYQKLNYHFSVEIAKKIKGFSKEIIVPLYLQNEKIAIINKGFNSDEDIINLLQIPDMMLYVTSYDYDNGYILIKIESNKEIRKIIDSLEKEIEHLKNLTNEMVSKIKPRFEEKSYLSLENKEECVEFYYSLSEEKRRVLTGFLTSLASKELELIIYDSFEELYELSGKVMYLDTLLNTFALLQKYKEDNKEKLRENAIKNKDDLLKYYEIKIRFLDYKLLIKEFNSRFRILQKWMQQFYDIVSTEKPTIKKYPNKNSLHYKSAIEATEELSKLWFISEVILFGSVAKGEETPDSDIDIAFKIGFDTSILTESRKVNLVRFATDIIQKVEDKYQQLMRANSSDEKRLINLLSLSMTNKRNLTMYEKTGFFEHAITMLKRDKFEYQLNDMKEIIHYDDIECVIVPTNNDYTYFIKVLHENDEYRYVQYYKHQRFSEEVILVQKIEKSERFNIYRNGFDVFFPFFKQSEYVQFVESMPYYSRDKNGDIEECLKWEILNEYDKGGVRLVKKEIQHPLKEHKY